jgi:hypothetical protein
MSDQMYVIIAGALILWAYHHWTTQRNSATIIQLLNWIIDNMPESERKRIEKEQRRLERDKRA